MKKARHFPKRPPHICLDNQIYFITVRTYRGLNYLRPEKYKTILLEVIKEKINKFNRSDFLESTDFNLLNRAKARCSESGEAGFSLQKHAKACCSPPYGIASFNLPEEPKGCDSDFGPGKNFDRISLYAFAILNNHYHLLVKILQGSLLPKFMGEINGKSSRLINTEDASIDQRIWANYFDKCIRNEEDFYKHLNYIHQNPIKHGNVSTLDKLVDYPFCSYKDWLKEKGKEFLDDCFRKYPIVDFIVKGDEF